MEEKQINNINKVQQLCEKHGVAEFIVINTEGMTFNANWIDIHMGFSEVEGLDGFVTIDQFEKLQKDLGVYYLLKY